MLPWPPASESIKLVKIPHKTLERKLFADGYQAVFGVDEVGMGCLAGPVVVCAARFTPGFYTRIHKKLSWLRDSKLLQADQREEFAKELLKEKDAQYQIAYCYPKTIDSINIYQAARQAMRRAIAKLHVVDSKTIVLVDGNKKIQGIPHDQQAIIKGDQKVFAISCASIIAKVFRDRMMTRYAKKYPGYGFEIHKGYATKFHRAKIKELGITPLHRKSFSVG